MNMSKELEWKYRNRTLRSLGKECAGCPQHVYMHVRPKLATHLSCRLSERIPAVSKA